MKKVNLLILSLILCIGLLIRIIWLDQVPNGLFGDEVDVGYQAYSLMLTGKDIRGNIFPLYVQSLAEYRVPLYIYSDIPFIALFGLNEWGVRLNSVFWGMVGILGVFYLVGKLINRKVALIATLFISISSWHIHYSRAGFEATMLLAFIIWGTYFFIEGLKRNFLLIISSLFFGLSLFIYSTANLFVPLWVFALVLIYSKDIRPLLKRFKLLGFILLVSLIWIIPLIYSYTSGLAGDRFKGVSIFQEKVFIEKINNFNIGNTFTTPEGEEYKLNTLLERVFHHKYFIYLQVFTLNYLRSFSTEFLFTQGDPVFRHSVHEMGQLYYFEIFLILIGIFSLLVNYDKRLKFLVITWLLLSPVPAALTYDGGFHATRLFIMIPPLIILSALGIEGIKKFVSGRHIKYIYVLLGILVLINLTFYFHRYFYHYPIESWRWWHIGYKESFTFIKDNEKDYSQLIFNNSYEPAIIRYAFWSKFDPNKFQKLYKNKKEGENILTDFNGINIGDRYYFGNLKEKSGRVESFVKPNMLYFISQREEVGGDWDWEKNPPNNVKVLKTIRNPYNEPLFYVITAK